MKVVWSVVASQQKNNAYNYWNKRNGSKDYSRKLSVAIRNRVNEIRRDPQSYKKSDYGDFHIAILWNYCIYYKIINQTILISAFWNARQNPEELLSILKK